MLISYVIKRILIAIPVLLLISFCVFMIIQLPPGSYIESEVDQMLREGTYDPEELRQLEEQYRFNDPLPVQYYCWITNFVQGKLGVSFEVERPVTTILATVLPTTMAISAFTILFTWSVAFPIPLPRIISLK